jgi:hypothetical protein
LTKNPRLNQDHPSRGDMWQRYKISRKVLKGKTPSELRDSANRECCEQEIGKIHVGNPVNDRSRPSVGTRGRDRKPIDILIIETHTSKWVGLAVGETPRVNLNRPSTWDTCQKSEESRGSAFCESWRTCNSKSRSAILRKEESSMWDPADIISSKRGIENFHGENPKVARTVHSRGRVATITIVVKFPERKVIHRKIVNREIGDSVDKRFSAFRHSKP